MYTPAHTELHTRVRSEKSGLSVTLQMQTYSKMYLGNV